MKVFRYKFQESAPTAPPTPDPEGRKRSLTAANETHARAMLGPAKKGKYWIKIETEVIDWDTAPPGYIPPKFIFNPENRKRYRKQGVLGHCHLNGPHIAHLYKTESGRTKACDGIVRTDISSRQR